MGGSSYGAARERSAAPTGLIWRSFDAGRPWVRFLPERDVHAFAVEPVDTMRAADSIGALGSRQEVVEERVDRPSGSGHFSLRREG
jgi:hypothetical protein